jgi:hypothetical protein
VRGWADARGLAEHVRVDVVAEAVPEEAPVQHLVVHLVVREPAGVARDQAAEASLHGGLELVRVERADPRLNRVLHCPEDVVPADRLVVAVAEVDERVGVRVAHLPLGGLRVVPLELVLQHRPVEVIGEEVHVRRVLDAGFGDARADGEAVLDLAHADLRAGDGFDVVCPGIQLQDHVTLAHLVSLLSEVLDPRDPVHRAHPQVHDLEVHLGRRPVHVHLGAVRLLLTVVIVVDAEGALDLAPHPRLNHHHAAADRTTFAHAHLDVHGVGAFSRAADHADPPGHAVRDHGPRRARERAAQAVLLVRAVRGEDVPAAGLPRTLRRLVTVACRGCQW